MITNIDKLDDYYNNLISNYINIIIPSNVDSILNNFFINIENKFQNYYFKDLSNIKCNIFENLDIYFFFINCVNNAHKNILFTNNNLFNILNNNIWKIYIYKNMMWELPFTMEDVIFMPEIFIKDCFINNNYKRLTKTLIHERIHICQRQNETIWENFIIKDDKNWIKITKESPIFDFLNKFDFNSFLNKIIIINPDTFYNKFKYIYIYNNEYYYGILFTENNIISVKWIKINLNTFEISKSSNILNHEHPYEIYAYKFSDDILL